MSHWRLLPIHHVNPLLSRELMALVGGKALSAITIQSLADLGYSVDVTQADPYTLPDIAAKASAKIAAPSTHAQPEWSCGAGQAQEPIYVVDSQGRIVRTIKPLKCHSRARFLEELRGYVKGAKKEGIHTQEVGHLGI